MGLRMWFFNAAFRIPFLSHKYKEKLGYSFLTKDKAKELKAMFHGLAGSMNYQFGAYEALMEYSPNYAKWNTDEEAKKIEGGKLATSGAALAILDFWTVKEVDLFFAKYITKTEDHMGFCRAVYRLTYNMQVWGYVDENDKPVEKTQEDSREMRETVWGGTALILAEEMPEPKRTSREWMPLLEPLFYPNGRTDI